jgi:hypothetical protein
MIVSLKVSPETLAFLAELRSKIAIGVVGGSDLTKQKKNRRNSSENRLRSLTGVSLRMACWPTKMVQS